MVLSHGGDRRDDSSNALTSVKKTRSLDNIFVFKDPENSLKKTSLGLCSL